jgi:hypothetical protein
VSTDSPKIERLIALTERLTAALEADIAALERGRAKEMRSIEPDIQQLTAFYSREAAAVGPAIAKAALPATRAKLAEVTKRFRETLALHARILTRLRNAGEGLIRAVAQDVEKKRQAARPYGRAPTPNTRSTGAMIYNSVI